MSRRIARYLTTMAAPAVLLLVGGTVLTAAPAAAQITVFDPTNYSQNLLTAARELQQINNQIQQLQNQATMLTNQAKNLMRLDFPEAQALTQTINRVQQLMDQARGISFRIDTAGTQFSQLYPQGLTSVLTTDQSLAAARSRYDAAMAAYTNTVNVQASVVGSIASDTSTLAAITARSQSAQGQLQASQATNQLLALVAKQQLEISQLMAAQYRAQSLEAATRAQAEAEGRAAAQKFIGNGKAYTPR
ncbi:P-type conjugative transfer protein TrbJ [Sphingomonas pruni]|uniref:P-type conjugative transfer protein TrbJ n=1 Tax=Sphingomonas pruni TaxID=40683 RepID=UPI00082D03DE|nr:P-type conjugative transfer protein TrbJ [Sphingomonas pruni]